MRVGGNAQAIQIRASLTGQVRVDGDLLDDLEVIWSVNSNVTEPPIWVLGDALGQVRVYGSLGDDQATPVEIQVGTLGASSAIVIDWDGFHEGDNWVSGAVVKVGPTEYYGNTYTARVYEVTPCRGDMNNDGSVGFPDINPFVAALSNPGSYAAMCPGLEGSMTYHGDANCDGVFDFHDINPFVARVTSGNCDCTELDGEPPLAPRELANMLAANIAPELYGALVNLVGIAIDWQETRELRAYWEAVYAALTQ